MDSPSRSGVFDAAADNRVASFTESISFDARLYAQDISGSIAHAKMLQEIGILTSAEAADIKTTLLKIKTKIEIVIRQKKETGAEKRAKYFQICFLRIKC